MLLIWGFSARHKLLDSGTFHCPQEGGDREYRRQEARRWFTFFWIPLIPLKVLGVYVECSSCGSTYDEAVLTMPTSAVMADHLTLAVRHMVVAMLMADGTVEPAERAAAVTVVNAYGHGPYSDDELTQDLATLAGDDLDGVLSAAAGMLSPQGADGLVRACYVLAASDGRVDDDELAMVKRSGSLLGLSPAHVSGVITEAAAARQG